MQLTEEQKNLEANFHDELKGFLSKRDQGKLMGMYRRYRERLLAAHSAGAQEPQWIVNDLGELGVKVGSRFFFLYKGGNIEYGSNNGERENGVALYDDGTPMRYRIVGKREFGETCHPITCHVAENGHIYDRTPHPYTVELVYTPGLSFGEPEDGCWKPLPAPIERVGD